MNLSQQRKFHERKIKYIDLIDLVQRYINRWEKFISESPNEFALKNAHFQKNRMQNLKNYLIKRYNN